MDKVDRFFRELARHSGLMFFGAVLIVAPWWLSVAVVGLAILSMREKSNDGK